MILKGDEVALFLTRDRNEGEVILWSVPDGAAMPMMDETGHWFSDGTHQTIFLPVDEIRKAPALSKKGGIVRVYLTETEPRRATAWKEKESPCAALSSTPN